jgi:hypothetical protein
VGGAQGKGEENQSDRSLRVKRTRVSGPTHHDFAGKYNPHYVLLRDYYGDVYAEYVGPYDGYTEYAIWVPKILVTNKRGPIPKWGPKSKN